KIHLAVFESNVTLYDHCEPHSTLPISRRGQMDTDGDIWIAKYEDDLSTVPLDLQWMVLSCDPTRPERGTCEEVPVSQLHTIPETCPQLISALVMMIFGIYFKSSSIYIM